MRKPIVAGNWKMHGCIEDVRDLLTQVKSIQCEATVIVFPPFVFLPLAEAVLKDSDICWGGQNLATDTQGAFTGEVSADMLKDFACEYVLIGHSERRAIYKECDADVAKKFTMAQRAGLTPMLCVGESQAQRESGETNSVVLSQLQAVIDVVGISALANAVVAYEPVWAIGTGLTATPEQAQAVHATIREHFAKIDVTIAAELRILYGGSVKAENAKELFAQPDIDGGLVGGASLKADSFAAICAAA
tara:strand:- start:49660 stop:50400 length:741 start_codon:yes stop_codon:yes gene_type:complete